MRTATDFQRMGDEWRLMASDFRDAGKDYEAALCEFHARVRDDAVHLLMLDPTLVIDLDALTAGRNDRPEPGAFRGRAAPADGVHLLRADRIAPESVDYLEASTIPLRVVTLVVGLDGVGKSTVLYDRAARATRGQLAGKYRGEPVDVVIASSEDHSASVIVPRLMAAGADLTRVHVVKVQRDGLTGEIALPDDLDELDRVVRGVGARLLIVDPLVAHMPMSIDSHKAQHVRRVLAPLARLAEEAHLAVCAVVHFNGSPSTDVRSRISGSKALRDASRSVLVCGVDPSDESRHVVVQDKNSFGPKPTTGRAYRIEAREIEHGGETFTTSGVVWLGDVEIDGRGLLGGPGDPEARSERDEAGEWLRIFLAEYPAGSAEAGAAKVAARVAGISPRTLECARKDVAKLQRSGFPARTYWTLIPVSPTDSGEAAGDGGGEAGETVAAQRASR